MKALTSLTMLAKAADLVAPHLMETLALILVKNEGYGDAYAQLGLKGLFTDIHGKYFRLRKLIWDEDAADPNAIREELRDLAAFGLLGLVLLDHPELTRPREEQEGLRWGPHTGSCREHSHAPVNCPNLSEVL